MKLSSLNPVREKNLWLMIIISTTVLFCCSAIRHLLYQSTSFDLGIFDQAIYLISQGKNPFSTLMNINILGDHGALILYPLALIYRIYPTVYSLFLVQALCLSLASLPLFYIAEDYGLSPKKCLVICWAYVLYPVLFNVNLFDFHPEVLASPFLFCAIWTARIKNLSLFVVAIVIILACKDVLSLTVVGVGIWLWLLGKRPFYGAIAIGLGVLWFLLVTQAVIPYFNPQGVAAVGRYGYLGHSLKEILINMVSQPQRWIGHLFSLDNLWYLILLTIPIGWSLPIFKFSITSLGFLIPALPMLMVNLFADYPMQVDLIHQYALPIFPFLILMAMENWVNKTTLLDQPKWIVAWSVLGFISLAKPGYFWTIYLSQWDTLPQTYQAVSLITGSGAVLTNANIVPHVSHREHIEQTMTGMDINHLDRFEFVLLNTRYPSFGSNQQLTTQLETKLEQDPSFSVVYQVNGIVLYSNSKILN